MDLTLSRARLADGDLVDIGITQGRIASVSPTLRLSPSSSPDEMHDLEEWLVLPAMAEPHAHLDKALTAEEVPNPTGDLRGAIEAWMANARQFTADDTNRRARAALDLLIARGVTAVRTHVNCGERIGAESVKVLAAVRDHYRNLIDLQLVALPAIPMTGTDGAANRSALAGALEAGADVVGGCPHLDPDGQGLIDVVFDAATDAGLPIDLHVDETLDVDTLMLNNLATTRMDRGFGLAVTASHCVSLGMQSAAVQAEISRQVVEADIAVVALPQTNLFLQGHSNPTAMPRGLTAVGALRDAGALVAAGADNVQDPFNLVGRSDPLETAALMVMAGHVLPDDAYAMVSANARQAMGLDAATIAVGDIADLVVIDAVSTRAAIADAPMSRRVYRQGRLIATSTATSTIHR